MASTGSSGSSHESGSEKAHGAIRSKHCYFTTASREVGVMFGNLDDHGARAQVFASVGGFRRIAAVKKKRGRYRPPGGKVVTNKVAAVQQLSSTLCTRGYQPRSLVGHCGRIWYHRQVRSVVQLRLPENRTGPGELQDVPQGQSGADG